MRQIVQKFAPHHGTFMPTLRRIWFRRILIMVGVLLCLGIPAYIELFLKRPVGTGPAGPPVERAALAKPWTDRPVLLLGIGDSITRGLGAKSADHSFFQRLLINPEDEWEDMRGLCLSAVLPNLASTNLSVSGSTSLDHAAVIAERLDTYPEELFGLVVMTTGGNDLIHSYGRRPPVEGAMYGATLYQAQPWIENFRDRLQQMIHGITDRFPGGCEIYLADIYDPTDGVGDAASIFLPRWNDGLAIHARYNEAIRQLAAAHRHVHLVPLYETFLGHGSHCRQFWRSTYRADDPHYWFYSNVEDPNDRGYDAIRRVFLNTIIRESYLRSLPHRPLAVSISEFTRRSERNAPRCGRAMPVALGHSSSAACPKPRPVDATEDRVAAMSRQ